MDCLQLIARRRPADDGLRQTDGERVQEHSVGRCPMAWPNTLIRDVPLESQDRAAPRLALSVVFKSFSCQLNY
jgi:hypothetical protein